MTATIQCPLCGGSANPYCQAPLALYHRCTFCLGVFLHRCHLPSPAEEIERYRQHNNDVKDDRFRLFVKPIVDAVLQQFTIEDQGLDFGAGTGPVISSMLSDLGYQMVQYDPFFHPDPWLLQQRYDYIVACEVIEHFHHPMKEFAMLRKLLKGGGSLFCKTKMLHPGIDFSSWYYKNDSTHAFFYQQETLEYIRKEFDFSTLVAGDDLIILSVPGRLYL